MSPSIKGKKIVLSTNISIQLLEITVFILLILSYLIVVFPRFEYMGFRYDFNLGRLILSSIFALIYVQLGKWINKGLLHTIWHMILIICLFPHLIYYCFSSGSLSSSLGYMIFLFLLFIISKLKLHSIKSKTINIQQKSNLVIILLITLVLFLPFLYYLPYINIQNLWLKDIYKTRVQFREIQLLDGFSYLLSPLSRVLLPALIIVSIKQNKYLLLVFIVLLTSYLFLASGAVKSVYFGIFMAIFFYFGKTYKFKLQLFILLIILLNIFGIFESILFNHQVIHDFSIRRVFFLPPMMEEAYYNYFANHEKTYYTHSILSLFDHAKYDQPVSRFIGEKIIGKDGLNANVGIVPDGFLSLGWAGVFINSIIISYFFLMLDRMHIDPIFFGVIFTYIYYFNTAFLGTLLLTHGFLFLILFAFFCLKNHESS